MNLRDKETQLNVCLVNMVYRLIKVPKTRPYNKTNNMKRFSIIITLLSIVSLLHAEGIITLSHNGRHSYFNYNELHIAIWNAAAGDTIFLSPGKFEANDAYKYDMNISRGLVIVGSGSRMNYVSNKYKADESASVIDINDLTISGSSDIVIEGVHFENATISGANLIATDYAGNLTLSNMSWSRGDNPYGYSKISIAGKSVGTKYLKLKIDRCDFSQVSLTYSDLAGVSINNSFLKSINGDDSYTGLEHCWISDSINVGFGYGSGCIVPQMVEATQEHPFMWDYYNYEIASLPDGIDCYSTAEELIEAGLIGSNNSAAGPFGGAYKLMYCTDLLTIDYKTSSMEYDSNNRRVKIRTKVLESE